MDSSYKHSHQNALIKLSRESRLYPECIVLKHVSFDPRNPAACGGFADIYKGHLRGQEIAVKRLRTYEKVDIDKLFKVTSLRNI